MKAGSVDQITGLDVPSGNSPIDIEMVETTPIFNPIFKEQSCLSYDDESKMRMQKWNKRIADKKSVINIILNRCDEDTRAEIALGFSYEVNLEAGELIKFLAKVRTVCKNTDDTDRCFGCQVTRITKYHLQPTTTVEKLLAAHLTNDAM